MTTWTPATSQAETWTANPEARVFSASVFSHSRYGGLRVFAIEGKPVTTTWTARAKDTEVWVEA